MREWAEFREALEWLGATRQQIMRPSFALTGTDTAKTDAIADTGEASTIGSGGKRS